MGDGGHNMPDARARCSSEAERAVLGCVLLDPRSLVQVMHLEPGEFYFPAHGAIWEAIVSLNNRREPIDTVTVATELRSTSRLQTIGGAQFIGDITDAIPTIAHIERYAQIVSDCAIVRRLEAAHAEGISRTRDPSVPVGELAPAALQAITEVSADRRIAEPVSFGEMSVNAFEHLEANGVDRDVPGIPTGLRDLDEIIGGYYPTNLYVIAGRPGMGKSAKGVYALRACSNAGKDGLFFSLEMGKQQVFRRVACEVSEVNSKLTRHRGMLSEDAYKRLTEGTQEASRLRVYVDDNPRTTAADIRTRALRFASQHDLGMVVVDYLQKIKAPRDERARNRNRESEVREAVEDMKALAKELQIPVIVLAQLNRKTEEGRDRRPDMAMLRESGAIEQEADVIMLLYRDEYYNRSAKNEERGICEIDVAKQRDGGGCDVVPVLFNPQLTKFADLTPEASAAWRKRRDPPAQSAPGSYANGYLQSQRQAD